MRPSTQLPILLLLLLPSLLITSCEDSSLTAPGHGQSYPTTIAPLSPDSLIMLREKFAQANPRICSGLDVYGFTSAGGLLCFSGTKGIGSEPDYDKLSAIAKHTIARNGRFTGVVDSSSLDLYRARKLSFSKGVKLTFENQIYHGLQVDGTRITVVMDSVGVLCISGNHYLEIYIPTPAISPQQAQESLIGMELIRGGMGPTDTVVVRAEHMYPDPERVILPHKTDNGTELRVTWRVPVGGHWHIFVDTMTRECLLVRSLIIY